MLLRTVLAAAAIGLAVAGGAAAQDGAPPADYVWAASCKTCHRAEYDAWDKTKHAHALSRLSDFDRGHECIGCHVTGAPKLAGDLTNANVQCEACHGPGRVHVDAAAAGAAKPAGIVRKPAESTCVQCHSDRSPHFKFFSYPALAPLVHQVTK